MWAVFDSLFGQLCWGRLQQFECGVRITCFEGLINLHRYQHSVLYV